MSFRRAALLAMLLAPNLLGQDAPVRTIRAGL